MAAQQLHPRDASPIRTPKKQIFRRFPLPSENSDFELHTADGVVPCHLLIMNFSSSVIRSKNENWTDPQEQLSSFDLSQYSKSSVEVALEIIYEVEYSISIENCIEVHSILDYLDVQYDKNVFFIKIYSILSMDQITSWIKSDVSSVFMQDLNECGLIVGIVSHAALLMSTLNPLNSTVNFMNQYVFTVSPDLRFTQRMIIIVALLLQFASDSIIKGECVKFILSYYCRYGLRVKLPTSIYALQFITPELRIQGKMIDYSPLFNAELTDEKIENYGKSIEKVAVLGGGNIYDILSLKFHAVCLYIKKTELLNENENENIGNAGNDV